MIKRIFFFLLTLITSAYADSLKITVSSSPLANIVGLIDNNASIETLASLGTCPHEYILKPSDFAKTQNSDFVIYMSDIFEPYIKPITKNSKAKIINVSQSIGIDSDHNMHIWMSLKYVKNTIKVISNSLHMADDKALHQIDQLSQYKKANLSGLKSVLLLSDSLEYLFEDMPNVKIEKLYIKPGMTSIQDIISLRKQNPNICILINSNENIESIGSKIGHKIIGIDSENWSLKGYKKIIDDINYNCTINPADKNGASNGI